MSSREAVHRMVVSADIKDSGRQGRRARLRSRAGMYDIFGLAFDAVGVTGGQLHLEDRGDGLLAAVAPEVPPTALVGLWLEEVHQGLREHNAGLRDPLRLRVAMHAGPVTDDGRGLVGRAVDLTCRLCDSEPARAVLAAADDVDLVFVVSDHLYRTVVAEGGRFVEPEHYRPRQVRLKETDETAWFHVPRRSEPPLPEPAVRRVVAAVPEDGERPAPRPAPRATPTKYWITVNGGPNQVVDGAEVHGDIVGVRLPREDEGGARGGGRG
ncbi:hypothetical protein JCM4814A_05200 [Streptomyces phaeofaciens JCM 4814]|uniref:Guanylate cyclase domain-containing protein n=1 Tax=Streptomyces phaeofaciens TaxID=68254 RepID=A0A918HE17_9ACTN|nr:hypothetical protein [Streptomyces phaeofaciens]GGT55212.1 hypothetical protein GCM10010226_35310 [Streptomyces phaeofaciens]